MTCRTEDLTCLGQQQGSEILGELKFETIFASRMTFAWILEVKMIIWGVSGGYSHKIRIIQMPVLKGFSEIQHWFPKPKVRGSSPLGRSPASLCQSMAFRLARSTFLLEIPRFSLELVTIWSVSPAFSTSSPISLARRKSVSCTIK